MIIEHWYFGDFEIDENKPYIVIGLNGYIYGTAKNLRSAKHIMRTEYYLRERGYIK